MVFGFKLSPFSDFRVIYLTKIMFEAVLKSKVPSGIPFYTITASLFKKFIENATVFCYLIILFL